VAQCGLFVPHLLSWNDCRIWSATRRNSATWSCTRNWLRQVWSLHAAPGQLHPGRPRRRDRLALCDTMERAVIHSEEIIDPKTYHTIKEVKNGQGRLRSRPPKGGSTSRMRAQYRSRAPLCPLRVHDGTRSAESGDSSPRRLFARSEGEERSATCPRRVQQWAVARAGGEVLIYYGSSDTRVHVPRAASNASSTIA